jgi:hypothetical protein
MSLNNRLNAFITASKSSGWIISGLLVPNISSGFSPRYFSSAGNFVRFIRTGKSRWIGPHSEIFEFTFFFSRLIVDFTAMSRVFHHASERKHGTLRRGITRHAQCRKSFMNVGDLPGRPAVVTREIWLVRMMEKISAKASEMS